MLPFRRAQCIPALESNSGDRTAQADGTRNFWTDCHVSEDFEMALRLQVAGSIVRLASYHGEEFKEGVSLTVFDEILRWQKYVGPAQNYQSHVLISPQVHLWL